MSLTSTVFMLPVFLVFAGVVLLCTIWKSSKVVEIDPEDVEKLFGVRLKQCWDGVERRSRTDRRSGNDRRSGLDRRKFMHT